MALAIPNVLFQAGRIVIGVAFLANTNQASARWIGDEAAGADGGVMLTVLAHSALYAFFSLYLAELGYAKPWVGALWAVAVGAEIVFFAVAGRFFARLHMHHWLIAAAGASALRFAATAAFGGVAVVLLLAQTLHCITFAAQHMACTSLIARYFPDELRARGAALYSVLGYGIPGVLGGLAGGWLSERLGLVAVFWAAALVSLAAAACSTMAARADNASAARRMSHGDVKVP